jgi:hypothetical protein
MLTHAISRYAEKYGLLSSTQEGFRCGRNTGRQLQTVVHTIEDAKLFGQDLYALYIDFSCA